MTTYVQSISLNQYGSSSSAAGSITIAQNDPHMSTNLALQKEDVQELQALATKIFNRRRQGFVQAIASMEVTAPLIEYDASKTIDSDELPF